MGNPTDAEDALSRAMLKAWEKAKDGTDDIKNFKAWLTKLTYNLCADIHQERNRGALGVESLDTIAIGNETELISQEETPVCAAIAFVRKMRYDITDWNGVKNMAHPYLLC